ncbi:hypothetical protein [Chryseobacterium sp. BIGb0232]|uniref:hypothetical protein n=1 Tax=Chryseobacterium sp. BIGb0232 TaxID=2940598 RepID=UPI000F4AB791|nr:hypothetical protein [Chryseobacterium sp. BIGb0232]MCS4304619.1 hypothetical protein [Chryseobacterium sp. BIGb0232]ROS20721.1 hypothetical protein EDF65_1453 [Chryseobacterium nakagawai]
MKSMLKIAAAGVIALMISSCVVHERRGVPPGHAKRVYGGSARYYAPGHVKKVYIYEDRGHHHRGRGHGHGHHR